MFTGAVGYYSAVKRTEVVIHAITRMIPEKGGSHKRPRSYEMSGIDQSLGTESRSVL